MQVLVTAIERCATFDGPGIRTVVYLKGCPLRCLWCSNPETQKMENEVFYNEKGISPITGEYPKVAELMTLNEIFDIVMKDEKFYRNSGGGVTLSGGEVLVNAGFAIKLFRKLKEEYIHTAIETTGFGNYTELEELAGLTDTVLFDIKHMNSRKHKKYTAVPNEIILKNLEKLSKWHKNIIMRFPLIKGINDDDKNIRETAEFLKKINLLDVDVLPYHTMGLEKYRQLRRQYPMPTLKKHTKEELEHVVRLMRETGVRARINN